LSAEYKEVVIYVENQALSVKISMLHQLFAVVRVPRATLCNPNEKAAEFCILSEL